MLIGWKTLYITPEGEPTEEYMPWKASCFVVFGFCIWIGAVKPSRLRP